MPVKKFKPVTPTQRFKTVSDFNEITRSRPEKSLVDLIARTGNPATTTNDDATMT